MSVLLNETFFTALRRVREVMADMEAELVRLDAVAWELRDAQTKAAEARAQAIESQRYAKDILADAERTAFEIHHRERN
jgi:hypothetical protein